MVYVPKLHPLTLPIPIYLKLTVPLCALSSLEVGIAKVIIPEAPVKVEVLFQLQLPF